MGNLLRRRMMLVMAEEQGPEDLVASFRPGTYSLGWMGDVPGSVTIPFVRGRTYQVVLDATTESSTRAIVYLGNTSYGTNSVNFGYGQDGEVTKTIKLINGTMTNKFWVYCRPSSNDRQSHSITIRSIKIYDIT